MGSEPSGIEEQQTTSLYKEGHGLMTSREEHDLMSSSDRQHRDVTMAPLRLNRTWIAMFASFTYME